MSSRAALRLRNFVLGVVLLLALLALLREGPGLLQGLRPAAGDAAVEQAFSARRSDVMLEVEGRVARTLADDLVGSRHQRFVIELNSGRTLLISHNIDLAPRVPLREGDAVEVRGEYEWNDRGGLLHWTHHDPRGRRPGGWIRHDGESYR